MQCKDGCQGFAEGFAKVSTPRIRLRHEKVPHAGVADPEPASKSEGMPEMIIPSSSPIPATAKQLFMFGMSSEANQLGRPVTRSSVTPSPLSIQLDLFRS